MGNSPKDIRKYAMNRLVLIGNGFDLAHNLKTRYSDFMLGLFKHELLIAENKKPRQVGNTFLDATDVEYQGTKLFTIQKDLRLKDNLEVSPTTRLVVTLSDNKPAALTFIV